MKRALFAGFLLLAAGAAWLLLDRRTAREDDAAPHRRSTRSADETNDGTPALAARSSRGARELTGIVVDEAAQPIVGAEIVVVHRDEAGLEGEKAARRVLSGEDGRFAFPDPPRDAVARALHPDHVEMGHEPVLESEDGVIEEMRFRLARDSSLEVTVRGSDGAPWANGVLTVRRSDHDLSHVTLDRHGTHRAERLQPGWVHLQAYRSEGDRSETVSGEVTLLPGVAARADLDGRAVPTVTGRVVRGEVGVAGADVWFHCRTATAADAPRPAFDRDVEVRTDEQGRFVVRGAFCEDPSCWIGIPNGQRGPVAIEKREKEWVLRLPHTLLEGRVIAAGSGAPIAGVTVSVRSAAEARGDFGGAQQVTDAEGRFRIEGLAPGRYAVHALRGDLLRQSDWVETSESDVAVEEGAETQVTLRMEAGGTATIVVVDGAGAPVRGAKVSWQRDPSRPDAPWGGTTAADGRVRGRGLRPGKTTVVVNEAGYSVEAQATVRTGEDTETRVVVPWRPLGLVRIRVVGARPLSRADVGLRLTSAKGKLSFSGAELEIDPRDPEVRLARLLAGSWRLVVSATRHVPWTVDVDVESGETRDLEVRLAWMAQDSTQEPDAPVEDDR